MNKISRALFFIIILSSCTDVSKNHNKELVTIAGKIKGFEGNSLYIKKINPINYNRNSVIDSTSVDSNGIFKFELSQSLPILLNISKYSREHPIHEIFRKYPDIYYYSYCAMFYVPEPTLYISENNKIEIDWTVADRIDSYIFDEETKINQDKFYDYYLNQNVGDTLYQDDGNFRIMDSNEAWNAIINGIKEIKKKHELDQNHDKSDFENYLNTEITLGAVNMYLNWYENIFSEQLNEDFIIGKIPEQYTNAINMYNNSNWNEESVEFYKMTERFITFCLNKSLKDFKVYYPSTDIKISMAENKLKPEVAKKYIKNIAY